MNPLDGDDDREFAFDEPSAAEQDLAPDPPTVTNYENRFPEPDVDDFESGADLDRQTYRTFIICVLLTNVAVFAVSLGAMLWFFRGLLEIAGILVLIGIGAGIRTYQHYRSWQQYRETRDSTDDETTAEAAETTETTEAKPTEALPDADTTKTAAEGTER